MIPPSPYITRSNPRTHGFVFSSSSAMGSPDITCFKLPCLFPDCSLSGDTLSALAVSQETSVCLPVVNIETCFSWNPYLQRAQPSLEYRTHSTSDIAVAYESLSLQVVAYLFYPGELISIEG